MLKQKKSAIGTYELKNEVKKKLNKLFRRVKIIGRKKQL